MCCETRRRYPRQIACLVVSATLAAALGCGKQGNPTPPVRAVPAATRNLAVRQQGDRLLLTFSFPNVTPAGTALGGLSGVEVWGLSRPAPPPPPPAPAATPAATPAPTPTPAAAPTPAPTPEAGATPTPAPTPAAAPTPAPTATPATPPPNRLEPVDPRQFNAAAKLLLQLAPGDLATVTFGDKMMLSIPLEAIPATPEAKYFAIRTLGPKGDRSDLSNQVGIVPKTPPPPPDQMTVTPGGEGIEVGWIRRASGVVGYNVYRRDAQQRGYALPLQTTGPEESRFLDTTARFGESYIYAVTTVAERDPLIESAITTEREVRYLDRFPPPSPTELLALGESGQVRLLWHGSDVADLAGYLVYRRRGTAGEFVRMTPQPIQETEYIDTKVASGQTLFYRVTAVDQSGNESAPSGETATPVP